MSKRLVVGSDPMPDWLEKYNGIVSEINKQLVRGLREQGKGLTLDQMQAVVEHRNPFKAVSTSVLDQLVIDTQKLFSKRFGKQIEIDPLPEEFTEENLTKWAEFNFKPSFLPDEEIGEDRELKEWVKAEPWFYRQIRDGSIRQDSAQLYKGWYLADFSLGADYTDGSQVFPNDLLAPIITELREQGKVGKYENTPIYSRFAITHDEWRQVVCPAVAEKLGFRPEQVRLERAIEFNAIGNLYDFNRGKFDMWEWFNDTFEDSSRLGGGDRGCGGLAYVYYFCVAYRYDYIAGRPLVSFV